jgi:hypothetical protein
MSFTTEKHSRCLPDVWATMCPNWAYTLFCGAYAFGDPIWTIGEQAPQQVKYIDIDKLTGLSSVNRAEMNGCRTRYE